MSIEELIPILGELVNELKKIPAVDQGIEYFVSKGYKTVEFNVEFKEPPSVNVRYESPEGWPGDQFPFTPPDIDLDEIESAALATLEKFDARFDFPDPLAEGKAYATWLAEKFEEAAKNYLDEANFKIGGIDFTGVRDNVISLIYRVGQLIGTLIEKFVFQWIKERLMHFRDRVKAKINEILSDIRQKIKDAFSDFKGKIEEVLDPFQDNLQDGFNVLSMFTCDALNLSLEKWYDAMGLPKGVLCIPAMVTRGSVTCTQFEVWSPGVGTLHWHAIGSQSMISQPIISKIETIIELKS